MDKLSFGIGDTIKYLDKENIKYTYFIADVIEGTLGSNIFYIKRKQKPYWYYFALKDNLAHTRTVLTEKINNLLK
jgi:hypothetical protein